MGSSPDAGFRCIICKTYIIINSNLLFIKTENRAKKSQLSSQTIPLNKGAILPKKCNLLQKTLTSEKLEGLGTKKYIL